MNYIRTICEQKMQHRKKKMTPNTASLWAPMLKSINYFVSVCLDIRNSHKTIAKEQHYTPEFATQVSDWTKLGTAFKSYKSKYKLILCRTAECVVRYQKLPNH